jgi:hypothetical protein
MSRQLRPMSLALLIAFLPSCYNWQEYGPTPQAGIQNAPPSTVYISRTGGSTTELRHVEVVGDSVFGEGVAGRRGVRPRITIPLTEVERVRTRKLNAGKTAGLVGAVVGAALLIPVLAYFITYEGDGS